MRSAGLAGISRRKVKRTTVRDGLGLMVGIGNVFEIIGNHIKSKVLLFEVRVVW